MRFRLFGVSVKVEYPLFAVLLIAILLGCGSVLYVLLFSALHETGHLIALYLLGGKADEIVLSYYGIGLKADIKLSNSKEVVYLLGGVAVNLLFYALGVQRQINLALALINILPIYPLDGGRVFVLILRRIFGVNITDMIYKAVMIIFIALLTIIAIYFRNISLGFIIIYIIFYSINFKGFV